MNLSLTIECQHCAGKRRAKVAFGEKSNDRIGVLAVYLPQGWESRTETANYLHGIVVRFVCPACAKSEKAKRELVEAAERESEVVDSKAGIIENDNA